ncbi:AraC family transcriptional regulator [Gracilibacillus sp. YIM 98692]|uniref:AraC family transcriptional regulator n=1 Tax=Gracilibacillus sp. YIM 98692 TaxID=2663532 RepID=UPI0013D26FC0|nr:AraC family transcriptional regulator [Gracilibacillus sp. YIM 98692]
MKFYKKRKMYTKMTLWIFVLCAIIIIPISLLLSKQFSKYAFSEINHFTRSELTNSTESIQFLLDRMEAYSLRIYVDERIQNYLELDEHNGGELWKSYKSVTNYLLDEPFIHTVYLINEQTGVVFDSKQGMFLQEEFDDQHMLELIDSGNYKRLTYFHHKREDKNYLAMIVEAEHYDGSMVTLLDTDMMEAYLFQNNQDNENTTVLLTDQNGQLLLGDDSWNHHRSNISDMASHNQGQYNMEIDDKTWSINYVTMDTFGWKLYYLTEIGPWQQSITNFQRNIVYASIVILLMIGIIVFWLSRKTYRPFTQLAESIEDKIHRYVDRDKKTNQEEHKMLYESFDSLIKTLNEMSNSIRKHKHLIKEENLRQWILQGYLNESIRKYISEETHLLNDETLMLLVVRIERYPLFLEKYNLTTRKAMKYAIGNIIEHTFQQKRTIEFADFGGDHMVLLFGNDNLNKSNLMEQLQIAKNQISKWLNLNVTIAISDPKETDGNLKSTYQEIYNLSTLKFITGKDKIYEESDAEKYVTMMNPVKDKVQDFLCQSIQIGNKNKVNEILDQIFSELQLMHPNECKFHLINMIYSLMKSFNQLTFFKSFDGIEKQIENYATLTEAREWLETEINHIMSDLEELRVSDRKSELVDEMREYINLHIHDPMLTVNQVADHLSLSVSYIRQVFKEVTKETISDYILTNRINRVKEMLQTTDWLIADIAERSGFQTKSNFYTVFKKAVGMTPSEYRQLDEEIQNPKVNKSNF